jgi:hypothetical protein
MQYFFIFVEGKAAVPQCVRELRRFPGMTVWEPSEKLDLARNKSRIWGEKWLAGFRELDQGLRGHWSEVRGYWSGVRCQGSGGQGSGVKGQGSGVRGQESGVR